MPKACKTCACLPPRRSIPTRHFPCRPVIDLGRLIGQLDRALTPAYLDMLNAHAEVVRNLPASTTLSPGRGHRAAAPVVESPALIAARKMRTEAATKVLAIWHRFESGIDQVPNLSGKSAVLAIFRLNDATYTRAAWFVEQPGKNTLAPLLEDVKDVSLKVKLAPPRVGWEKRFGSLIPRELHSVAELQEATRSPLSRKRTAISKPPTSHNGSPPKVPPKIPSAAWPPCSPPGLAFTSTTRTAAAASPSPRPSPARPTALPQRRANLGRSDAIAGHASAVKDVRASFVGEPNQGASILWHLAVSRKRRTCAVSSCRCSCGCHTCGQPVAAPSPPAGSACPARSQPRPSPCQAPGEAPSRYALESRSHGGCGHVDLHGSFPACFLVGLFEALDVVLVLTRTAQALQVRQALARNDPQLATLPTNARALF